jgi:hypothetical protein
MSRRLFFGLQLKRPEFDHSPVKVGFMVDEEALEQGFLREIWIFPVIIIPLIVNIRSDINHVRN